MKLEQLLEGLDIISIQGQLDKNVTSLTSDSRKAGEGAMFVAVRGVTVDGHSFIPTLADKKPAAIVVEEIPAEIPEGATLVVVANTAIALGILASNWYGNPSSKLRLVGVTGTNGKTTTATLIYEMARLMGHKAGLLSTVVNYVDTEAVHASQTTPDPITINSLLARMVEAGCEYAAMEVSSHAADQHRIAGLTFAGGVFTNLTRDHLDYHKTVQNYLNAKKSFFDGLPAEAFALTNIDDKVGEVMLQNTKARKLSYSLRSMADFRGKIIESRLEKVLVAMSRLIPVAGRFQAFHSPKGCTAIVDYAHTPDAVVNVLTAIREVVGTNGRIITVVGAGGNRDKGKRPIMAREAARLSDLLILTSDNPRFENPAEILRDMEAGLDTDELRANASSVVDRREAIVKASEIAGKGDVILIAGKGHEDYQEIRGIKHHFDDAEVVREVFAACAE